MRSIQAQLLANEREWLRNFTGDPDIALTELLSGAWDYRTWKSTQGFSPEGLAVLEAAKRLQYPHWDEEQCRVALAIENFQEVANLGMSVTRRILREEPAELGAGLSLASRLMWLSRRLAEQSGMGSEDDDLALIPMALAARDVPLAEKAAATKTPAGVQKDEIQKLMGEAASAILRRDLAALGPVTERLAKRKVDRTMRWMVECLQGIAHEDPQRVASALQQSLQQAERDRKKDEAEFPISIETHVYHALSQWVSPELVVGFDVDQPLPWDAGLHAWTQEHPEPLAGLDLNPISPLLHRALIHLELPDWWRIPEEPDSPHDVCRLILRDAGPQPRKVREIVETWTRIRKWQPVSLDVYPVVLTEDLPRLNAWMMRRSLLEIGAAVDFECVRRARPR